MKIPVHMYTTGATSLPKRMASSPVLSGVRISQSLVDLRSHVEVSMHVQDYLRISSIRCSHDNISMLSPVMTVVSNHTGNVSLLMMKTKSNVLTCGIHNTRIPADIFFHISIYKVLSLL